MGGGTIHLGYFSTLDEGLSPRGRGNPLYDRRDRRRWRSIPAWAGEPTPYGSCLIVTTVYPRVGGGTAAYHPRPVGLWGLSPRGRGNQEEQPLASFSPRSIPAWAGEPLPRRPEAIPSPVYPRVGGGTMDHVTAIIDRSGLSPRGRGNPRGPARGRACYTRVARLNARDAHSGRWYR